MSVRDVKFDEDLIRRYDRSGPRYTSYPTAVQFTDEFGLEEYRTTAKASNEDPIMMTGSWRRLLRKNPWTTTPTTIWRSKSTIWACRDGHGISATR